MLFRSRQAVEDLHLQHCATVSPWVTISVGGVTVIPAQGDSYKACLQQADAMLYDAKRLGRNQVVWLGEKREQWTER